MRAFRWVFFIITVGAIFFGLFMVMNHRFDQTAESGSLMLSAKNFLSDDKKTYDEASTGKYMDELPEEAVVLDDQSPDTKEEILFWENRITLFADEKASETPDQQTLHKLAVYMASLIRLLKVAHERESAGLEPFTGSTGFNTMALVMTLETEFENRLGCTFSEFFASQEVDELKSLLKTE